MLWCNDWPIKQRRRLFPSALPQGMLSVTFLLPGQKKGNNGFGIRLGEYIMKKSIFVLLLTIMPLIAAQEAFTAEKKIAICTIKEAITPVTEKYIKRSMDEIEIQNIDALMIVLDTPGGLLESTRNIVQILLNSKRDTIVYVAPKGARAGSAGVFITLAAKYAAMAPACNIGAAHPVTIGQESGKDDNAKNLMKKVENDTIAFIDSIARIRNRNREWAIKAVRESVSVSSEEALKSNIINYIAEDETSLVKKIYGSNVKFEIKPIKKNWAELLLTILANPNLAYFLMILGFYGILYEIIHPGTIFSGALGALFLIISLYSMQYLPFSFAGFALIVLSFILFIMEIFVTSYGLLTIGGLISLVIGSAMLFDSPSAFFRVSLSSITTVVVTTIIVVILLIFVVSKALRKKASSGKEGMIEQKGIALEDFKNGKGKILIHGEIWTALSEREIKKGEEVKVKEVSGLKVKVV